MQGITLKIQTLEKTPTNQRKELCEATCNAEGIIRQVD